MHTNKKLLKSIFSFALVIMMFLSISIMAGCSSKEAVVMEKETDNNSNNVGLSMKCYRLGKEKRTYLGERQFKGRIGK